MVTSAKRAERNKAVKSELKTTIKKFDAAIAENDKAVVDTAFREAVKMVDQAAAKGVIKKRTPLRERNPSSRSRSTRPARNIPRIQSESGSRRALLFCPDFTGGRQTRRKRAAQGKATEAAAAHSVAAAGPPEKEAGTAGRRGGEWRRLFFAPCLPAGDGAGRARRLREGTTEAGPLAGRAKKHMENKRRAGTLMYRPSRCILALSGQ